MKCKIKKKMCWGVCVCASHQPTLWIKLYKATDESDLKPFLKDENCRVSYTVRGRSQSSGRSHHHNCGDFIFLFLADKSEPDVN